MTFGGEARRDTQAPGETLILEGCAIATVDGAGTEYRDGHIVIENDRITAVGEGPGGEHRLAGGPAALSARDALARATIDGARCLGREAELGSLEPGKLADIALWRIDDLAGAGIEDPVAALVLGPPREVELLLVGGRAVVEDGELRTADEAQVAIDIERASRRLAERTVPSL